MIPISFRFCLMHPKGFQRLVYSLLPLGGFGCDHRFGHLSGYCKNNVGAGFPRPIALITDAGGENPPLLRTATAMRVESTAIRPTARRSFQLLSPSRCRPFA
jgi:hypothetical protein